MNKKNLILLIVFLLLVSLAVLYQSVFVNRQAAAQKAPSFLAGLAVDDVDKLEIEQPGKDKIILTKQLDNGQTRWQLQGSTFFVNQDSMQEILASLHTLADNRLLLASKDKGRKDRFGTDEAQGVLITMLTMDNVAGSMVVGRNTRDYNYTYISEPADEQTYMTPGNIYGMFVRSDWRDLTIFKNDNAQVNKIRIQRQDNNLLLEQKDGQWWAGKDQLDSLKIAKLISAMTDLKAVKLPEQTFANTGLEQNSLIVQVSGTGVDNILMIGSYVEENQSDSEAKAAPVRFYYAKTAVNDNIYLIDEQTFKVLNVSLVDLQK
jgi:hypothetical protein